MSLERAPRDAWMQLFVLTAALAVGLWAYGQRSAPDLRPTTPALEPAAAPDYPGRKRPRNGKEWIVDQNGGPNADAATIAAAVADASAGDTIRVRLGLYRESIAVDKALTIQGDGKKEETVLIASGPFALSIRSGAVTVKDLSLSAPPGLDGRAIEVWESGWLSLSRSSVSGFESKLAVTVARGGTLLTEDVEFGARDGTAVFVQGRAELKGGVISGGKTLAGAGGETASLEATGVSFQYGNVGLATGDGARAVLTRCSFKRLKAEVIALSGSSIKLILPSYDRPAPHCIARGGRAECGTPLGL